MRIIYSFIKYLYKGIYICFILPVLKGALKECGSGVYIGPNSSITYEKTSIGNNSSIGANALFMSTRANINIGNHVMIGPHVFIITGNHRIDIIGRYMSDVMEQEKLPENDQDVVINDDVWVGASAIILKGITIGKGSVIAAGSVVTRDVEPYSIYAGVPAKKIKNRFSEKEILQHEKICGL